MNDINRNIINFLQCRICTEVCNEAETHHTSCISILLSHQSRLLSFRLSHIAFVTLLISLFFSVCGQRAIAKETTMKKYSQFSTIADKGSNCADYIQINGSTNVKHFRFIQELSEKKELDIKWDKKFNLLEFKIPVNNFKSTNRKMDEDFMELIKADEYPYIQITIHVMNAQLISFVNDTVFYPEINVQLAGKSHSYRTSVQLRRCQDQSNHVFGEVHLNLDDFDLEPPLIFFGLVKVKKDVLINFALTLSD